MPALGSGVLVGSYGPYTEICAIYLASYVASAIATPPTAKLGTGEPATGTWTKMGLLEDDNLKVATTQATFVEDRRGFKKVLYARAINQSGAATFTVNIVESDPASVAKIVGGSATPIGAVGEQFRVDLSQLFDRTVLIYSFNAFDNSERYIHVPHAQVRYELAKGNNDVWVLTLTIEALQFQVGATNYLYEEGRFS